MFETIFNWMGKYSQLIIFIGALWTTWIVLKSWLAGKNFPKPADDPLVKIDRIAEDRPRDLVIFNNNNIHDPKTFEGAVHGFEERVPKTYTSLMRFYPEHVIEWMKDQRLLAFVLGVVCIAASLFGTIGSVFEIANKRAQPITELLSTGFVVTNAVIALAIAMTAWYWINRAQNAIRVCEEYIAYLKRVGIDRTVEFTRKRAV